MRSVARVLMTADARGGVWTYALELAAELGNHEVDVFLAVMGGGITDAQRSAAASLRNVDLSVGDYKLEWMDSPWDDVAQAGDWLLELAERFDPDIVHLNGYAHAALPWKTPVAVVAHSCVLSWFDAVRKQPAPHEWARYRNAVSAGLAAADIVIAPSLSMLREMERHYGRLSHTRVIHNGRSAAGFHVAAKQNFILSAGRLWDDAKNIQLLAEIAPQLDWPVYVAGEIDCHLAGVHALGMLDASEMADQYARAAIYAHPALYEPFGLAVLEAALSGCALLLSDLPSLREIWGDAAVYADPSQPDLWRDALNRLSHYPEQALDARPRALELTAAAMANQYKETYQQAQEIKSCVSPSSVIRSAPTGTMEMPIFSAV